MAVSAQITLRKKPNSKGQYPFAIKITKNRRSAYRHIGQHIDIKDWDSTLFLRFINVLEQSMHPKLACSKKINLVVCIILTPH